MAKKLTSKQKKEQLNNLFAQYNLRLGMLYSSYVKQLTALGYDESVLEGDALFNFDNFPQFKERLNDIFNDYYQNSLLCYKNGMTDGVALAFSHDTNVLGAFSVLSDKAIRVVRDNAAATFIKSRFKSSKGLNLAQSVWNYCQQTKSEFEMAMSNVIADGIKGGTSAEELGRQLRKYLNNPDMMYRRYHTVKVLKNGQKKDVVTWRRRRVIDGKVRFVEEPLEKVGMGVYRSARKNAFRVARTEINAAYLRGHNERWRNEPFVIGQFIHVSPQHVIDDICNELEGRYPKDFIFASWHPSCLCTSDPIMIEGEEKKEFYKRLMAGEDMSNYISPFAVTDTPPAYKQYIEGNEKAIMKAFRGDKLAWHLADNKKYWQRFMSPENQKEMGYTAKSARELILEAAEKRHAQRTKEQIDKIQGRWDKHRRDYYNSLVDKITGGKFVGDIKSKDLFERYYKIRVVIKDHKSVDEVEKIFNRFKQGYETKLAWTDRKVAMNVLKTAQKYGETDFSNVQALLQAADYAKAREAAKTLAKQIKAVQQDEALLAKLIPDVNKWHKQFTSQELHGVYDAVENKLSQWNSLTLEKQASKLKFEAEDFLGGNMHGVQQKYATWQVSQAAYFKKLEEVNDAIDWININNLYADVSSYKSQSKIYHKMVYDLKNAIVAKDKDLADNLLAEAMQKKEALINAKAKRNAKNVKFDTDAFSQARKDAAVWDKGTGATADKTLIDTAGKQWVAATGKEKDFVYEYTSHYCDVNEPLQGRMYSNPQKKERFIEKVNNITSYIEKNELPSDMWFTRGDSSIEVIKSRIEFAGGFMPGNLQDLVGMEMQEGGFMSTGSRKGKGFSSRSVILNIYAPKGTKAAYLEPISAYGNGAGRNWNGVERFSSYSSEHETLFQRGTKMRITKVYQEGSKTYIDCEVVGQELKDLSYVKDSNIGY